MDKLPRILRLACVKRSATGIRCYSRATQDTKDLYAVLGVGPKATQADIKQAYYNLTMKYHPDRNENSLEASIKFREVTEAYEVLGSVPARERYDLGGMAFVEPCIPPARQQPIQHTVKLQSFYDRRNLITTKRRTPLGDTTNQLPKNEVEPPEYNTPEEKIFHERVKLLTVAIFMLIISVRSRLEFI